MQGEVSGVNLSSPTNDVCVQQVVEACMLESEAIGLDRSGKTVEAVAKYRECEKALGRGIQVAISTGHMDDHPKLVQHRRQVLERINHLSSLGGTPATTPLEQHIEPVELSMVVRYPESSTACDATDMKTMAAYAALGAGAGFLVLGSTVAVVGGAAGGAYLATRQGNAGEAVRAAGDFAMAGADKAMELSSKHEIPQKIAEAGNKAFVAAKSTDEKYCLTDKVVKGMGAVVQKGKEMDEKHCLTERVAKGVDVVLQKGKEIDENHGVADKITQGVGVVLQKGKEVDDKHQVTDKVASGFAMGMNRISGWFGTESQSTAQPMSSAAGRC